MVRVKSCVSTIPFLLLMVAMILRHYVQNCRAFRRDVIAPFRSLRHYSPSKIFALASSSGQDESNTVSRLPPIPDNCHRFVLMRHGESAFNNANIFTGWCDVALTQRGVVEAVEAGEVFLSQNLHFRKCYVSLLSRSIVTAHRALDAGGVAYTPLDYDYRWNERHYGALQGLSKEQTAVRLGREIVMQWRRSYSARPPLMTDEHPHFQTINKDPRYRHLEHVPRGESLEDCQERVILAWKETVQEINGNIEPLDFNHSLLVAHANTLRALVMHLDDIDAANIEGLNVPTAIPFFYDVNLKTGEVMSSRPKGAFRGIFITDERKQRSFLERRRAANDPFMWALHDDQVATSMLSGSGDTANALEQEPMESSKEDDELVVEELEAEARKNTELFAPGQSGQSTRDA